MIFVQQAFEQPLNRKQNRIHVTNCKGESFLLNEDQLVRSF
ncbi:hypothetical protein HMPREF9372_0857 [Sporosarcina newyorkensis 2681]|uniref:Uncharacterized protein n=1 Tax=Sporosarcina newyorkensis 2681 TaxID=1027292 RepID=F9DPX7_9BACL|nr:hypothetical protein HMPREF9372_0857 [Sporosarcina newyorkensis 2681]